jgi:hypothetical protein
MAAGIHNKVSRWLVEHLFWDTSATAREGFWGWLAGSWKLLAALVGAALLTWVEWEEHHPPEIAIVALIHFVFVLIVIALIVHIGRWFRRMTHS